MLHAWSVGHHSTSVADLHYLLKQACCSKMFCNDNVYYRVKNKLNVVCVRSTGDVCVHRLPLGMSVQPDKLVSNEGGCVLKGVRTSIVREADSDGIFAQFLLKKVLLVKEEDEGCVRKPPIVQDGAKEPQSLIHTVHMLLLP